MISLNKHEIVAISIQDIKNVRNIYNASPNIAEKGRGSFYALNSQCKGYVNNSMNMGLNQTYYNANPLCDEK